MKLIKDLLQFATRDESVVITTLGSFLTGALTYEMIDYDFMSFIMAILIIIGIVLVYSSAQEMLKRFDEFRAERRDRNEDLW